MGAHTPMARTPMAPPSSRQKFLSSELHFCRLRLQKLLLAFAFPVGRFFDGIGLTIHAIYIYNLNITT